MKSLDGKCHYLPPAPQIKFKESKVELYMDVDKKDSYVIRKGMSMVNCAITGLTKKDLAILMVKINKIVNKGI
jgi:hypothetical protein